MDVHKSVLKLIFGMYEEGKNAVKMLILHKYSLWNGATSAAQLVHVFLIYLISYSLFFRGGNFLLTYNLCYAH